MSKPLHIMLVAGEPSGDLLGARLIRALRQLTGGQVRFTAVGGEAMAAEGVPSLFDIKELAIMGIVEVIPKIPLVFRRIRQSVAAAVADPPDVLVTIDSPSFSLEVAGRVKTQLPGTKRVHYVAPQVWAWKPWRAKQMAGWVNHLMALLPFEPPFFEAAGLACDFVGHPVVEALPPGADLITAFRAGQGLDPGAPLLAVLPGSRSSEVKRLLPVMGGMVRQLAAARPGLHFVVPTVATVKDRVMAATADWPRTLVLDQPAAKAAALAAADAAVVASGTAALELAVAGTPMVVTYRLAPVTHWIAKRAIKVRFANLINLVLDREVIPERLQHLATPEILAADAGRLLDDREARDQQLADVQEALAALGAGGEAPSMRAARVVLKVAGQPA